ncbi:hypothetical protein K474DRAFT_1706364 [Panus rudis PR-1116 ss-1]|nr:hypothetical protein K474DRAFT_1706364 [Panus rudis PR-1116 ss-1]
MSEDNDSLLLALKQSQVSSYCVVAALALLIYDQLLTLSREIRLIWGRKRTGATIVFLLLRYMTLINRISLAVVSFWWPNQTDKTCVTVLGAVGYSFTDHVNSCYPPVLIEEITLMIAYFVLAALSALRIYAIWNKDLRLALLVFIVALGVPGTNLYHFAKSKPAPWPAPFVGCGEDMALTDEQFAIGDCPVLSSPTGSNVDVLVIVFTWIKTIGIKRVASSVNMKASLSTLLLRDGTIYFGTLLALHIAHFVTLETNVIWNPLPIFIDAITTILITRFILNLRTVFLTSGGNQMNASSLHMSQFSVPQFAGVANSVVGNLGAPLGHTFEHSMAMTTTSEVSGEVEDNGYLESRVDGRQDLLEEDKREDSVFVTVDPLAAGLYTSQDNVDAQHPASTSLPK